nr:hypothetical protein [Chromobacterium violaceum]
MVGQFAVGLGAGRQCAVALQRAGVQREVAAGAERLVQGGLAGDIGLDRSLGAGDAIVPQLAVGLQDQVLLTVGLAAQDQVAGAGQLQIAGLGRHGAQLIDADPLLGAHQLDRVGVHATQLRHVQRESRGVARAGRQRLGRQRGGVHLVAAQHQVQLLRVQIGVDRHRPADDGETVDIGGV